MSKPYSGFRVTKTDIKKSLKRLLISNNYKFKYSFQDTLNKIYNSFKYVSSVKVNELWCHKFSYLNDTEFPVTVVFMTKDISESNDSVNDISDEEKIKTLYEILKKDSSYFIRISDKDIFI